MRRLKILAWDSHGAYLRLLSRAPHDFYVLARPGVEAWAPNVRLLGAGQIKRQRLDLLLFQDERQYLDDQYEVLSAAQRRLPAIYLEHEPPREHPFESRHIAGAAGMTIVHASAWSRLMWDCGAAATRVIEPGLPDPGLRYSGELARGLAAVAPRGGRRLGADLFGAARRALPLEAAEAPDPQYRFFFDPARHGGLTLAFVEAMLLGMPVLCFPGAGMSGVVRDGENGFVSADPDELHARMRGLLADRAAARALGRRARRDALARFALERFIADWNRAFADAADSAQRMAA